MSETQEFLKELEIKPESDILGEPQDTEESKKVEEVPSEEDSERSLKNRREKRLYKQVEARGKEVNALAEEVVKLRNVVEAQEARKNTEEAEYLKLAERIYGTDTPNAKEATEILKKILTGVHDSAREEALKEAVNRYQEDKEKDAKAVEIEEKNLDDIVESLAEKYGADFEDKAVRTGYFNLLEKLSPKDSEGNIIEYADPYTTYELFESRREKSTNKAKELAAQSMTRSGASQPSKLEEDANIRFLKENGII